MPIEIINTAGGSVYANPIIGQPLGVVHVKVDVSTLTTDEVDANGCIKPGVILKQDGTLIAAGGAVAWGVVIEATKIPNRKDNVNLAADAANDFLIAVATMAVINRDIAEDNLGRSYSANELSAINAAGSTLKLTTT